MARGYKLGNRLDHKRLSTRQGCLEKLRFTLYSHLSRVLFLLKIVLYNKDMMSEKFTPKPEEENFEGSQETSEKSPETLEEKKERSRQRLQEVGILEIKEGGQMVVDIDKITEKGSREEKRDNYYAITPVYGYEEMHSMSRAYFEFFKDKKVISKRDWENGERESRDLFYTPGTPEDAFDINSIKSNDFYIGFWNFASISEKRYGETTVPTKNGGRVSFAESSLACFVYHPKFGDGEKNVDGIVEVKYEDGSRGRITDTYLDHETPLTFGIKQTRSSDQADSYYEYASKACYLADYCPNLVQKHLLEPADFVQAGVASKKETSKIRREKKLDLERGRQHLMHKGWKYYLDVGTINSLKQTRSPGRGTKFVELSNELAAITQYTENDQEEIRHILHLKPGQAPKQEVVLKASETDIEEYNPAKWHRKRPDEPDYEYYQRVARIGENYQKVSELTHELFRNHSINLASLNMREQQIIASSWNEIEDREGLNKFINRYQEDGLVSLSACEYGQGISEKMIELGEEGEPEQVSKIFKGFHNTSQLITLLRTNLENQLVLEEIDEDLRNNFLDQFEESITRRTKDLLLAAHKITTEKSNDLSLEDIDNAFVGLNKLLEFIGNYEDYEFEPLYYDEHDNESAFGYRVKDKEGFSYKLKFFVRPESNDNGEARVNLLLNFDVNEGKSNKKLQEAFRQEITWLDNKGKVRDQSSPSELSIRLDLDSFYTTKEGQPFFSLDLGRSPIEGTSLKRTGDILGRALLKVSEEGSHNIDSFVDKFSDQRLFAKLANKLKTALRLNQEEEKV